MAFAITGIDPGLVHSAFVRMYFDDSSAKVYVDYGVVDGLDVQGMKVKTNGLDLGKVFIEGYRTRGNLSQNNAMIAGVQEFRKAYNGEVLNNMGMKQVVRRPLMEAFGLWTFPVQTHHQDIRSAARIMMFGALKDPALNALLAERLFDHLGAGVSLPRHIVPMLGVR